MVRSEAGEVGKDQMAQGQAKGLSVTGKSHFQVCGVSHITLVATQRVGWTGTAQEPEEPFSKCPGKDAEGRSAGLRGETVSKV